MKRFVTFILTLSLIGGIITMFSFNSFASEPDFTAVSGQWTVDTDKITGNNKGAGDCFCMSDLMLDGSKSFMLSVDFTMDGNAVGLVLAADRENPSADWYCINYDTGSDIARLFRVKNGTLEISSPVGLTAEVKAKATHNFQIVGVAGGQISFYADGLLAGSIGMNEFKGGYAGVMTCVANGSFTNFKCEEITMASIKSMKLEGVELTPPYTPDGAEFLGYVPYSTEYITVTPDFEGDMTLTVNGKKATSGEPVKVKLGIGYNQIAIKKTARVGESDVSTVQYLNIHRAQSDEMLYKEDYRPWYHYSSEAEWINDPNGMCYDAATGLYHLFYQTRPRTSSYDANQCWYHAVSSDLIHWEQLEPALVPDELGFCWSGSGNIDGYNTSGLFPADSEPESRMVLAFSSVYGDTTYGTEKISLAYTPDAGKTWKTYDLNPIIKNGDNHVQQYNDGFRDPKLLWFEDSSYKNGGVWLMLVGGGQGRIFSSENLLDWKFESAITDADGNPLHGECPDFFQIKVEGTNQTKWVYMRGYLDLDANPQIFQTRPSIGDLHKNSDGVFVFEVEADTKQVMYEGNILYATQSFANAPDGRIIEISWAREWLGVTGASVSANAVKDWNGLMSLPMELKLYYIDGQYVFKSYPVAEVENLRGEKIYSAENVTSVEASGKYTEAVIELIPDGNDAVFTFRGGKKYGVNIKVSDYDAATGSVKVTADGTHTGKYNGTSAEVIAKTADGKLTLRIYVDANSVGVICGDGEKSAFALAYPMPENTAISYTGSATVKSINIWELNSCFAVNNPDKSKETTAETETAAEAETTVNQIAETVADTTAGTKENKSGCCSSAAIPAVVAAVGAAAGVCKKKKRKQN